MSTEDDDISLKRQIIGCVTTGQFCRFCDYKIRIIFINGTPRYYECWKCGSWGCLKDEHRAAVACFKPKEKEKGVTQIKGSTGSVYDISWKRVKGVKIGFKCTCKGFAFRGKCKHLLKIND